jgi:DNA-binding IscR family transcriptional regulator
MTLAEAIEALDGPIVQSEPDEANSAVLEAWSKAVKAAHDVLAAVTIEDLCQRQRQLSQALNYVI